MKNFQSTKIISQQLFLVHVFNVHGFAGNFSDSFDSQRSDPHKQKFIKYDSVQAIHADDLSHADLVPPWFETWNKSLEVDWKRSKVPFSGEPISCDGKCWNDFPKRHGHHSIWIHWFLSFVIQGNGNSRKWKAVGRFLPFLEGVGPRFGNSGWVRKLIRHEKLSNFVPFPDIIFVVKH